MACQDCFTGTLHEGTPAGQVRTIHTLPTYVSDPPPGIDPKAIIVIISDAFGWELSNNRVLADAYARRGGYTVYLPDFMNGHSLPDYLLKEIDNFTSHDSTYVSKAISLARTIIAGVPWRIQTRPSITYPRLFDFMTSLRQSANLPIGAAGFCWGGKPLTLLCDGRTAPNGRTLVDAGYTAHPSYLKVPEDITPLKVPYSVCIGNVDMTMNIDEVKKMEDTLKGVQSIEGRWEVVVVEGAKHGFAVRGDPTKEDEAKQCQQAEDQAIAWFGKWLGKETVPRE